MESVDLAGVVLDGRYKVLESIAKGAMGTVYRAERLKLGKIVAVKVLHDELPDELSSRKRFEIEATAMAKLEHPNCAAVLDVGVHEGRPFVVMDFITGSDLKGLVDAGPVPPPRAISIVRQVLSGLAHAHELGIIHRDIKPANVILGQKAGLGDHVKILDFGLARLQEASQVSKLTTGIVVGTPAYMAPEQIRGTAIDHRADLYACGVLLFELLTGKKPFSSPKDDPIEVVSMHLKNPVPRLDAMLPGTEFGELEAVVAKALQKAAADRYQTATEFVAALDATHKAIEASQAISASMVIPAGDTKLGVPAVRADVSSAPVSAPVAVPRADATPAPPPPAVPNGAPVSFAHDAPVGLGIKDKPSGGTLSPKAFVPPAPVDEPFVPPPPAELIAPIIPQRASTDPMLQLPPVPLGAPGTAPRGLPFSRKQLAIGGGALAALLVVIIAVAARGGDDKPAPRTDTAPVAAGSGEIEMPAEPVQTVEEMIAAANKLVDKGQTEAALKKLLDARKAYPNHAEAAFLAGKLYFAKLWWTDGLAQFRDAIRIDPHFRQDGELIQVVLKGFITTPSYNRELGDFLVKDIGPSAQSFLDETAREHPNASIRKRAATELERFP